MDRVSNEELERIIGELDHMPMSQAATRPQAKEICLELQRRRATDRKVIEAKKDYMRAESHNDSVELAVMLNSISELESELES